MAKQCTYCKGSGILNCNLCGGRKYVKAHVALKAKGRFVAPSNEDVACPVCEGRGGSKCWLCEGTGQLQSEPWWQFWKSKGKPATETPASSSPALQDPLFLAVKNQSLNDISDLLAKGADCNIANEKGWTCLHEAATTGPGEMLELLIKHGANVEARTNDKALTPLHVAALWHQREAAKALLKHGADKAAISAAGKMPRDYAASVGDSTLAKLLSTEQRYL